MTTMTPQAAESWKRYMKRQLSTIVECRLFRADMIKAAETACRVMDRSSLPLSADLEMAHYRVALSMIASGDRYYSGRKMTQRRMVEVAKGALKGDK